MQELKFKEIFRAGGGLVLNAEIGDGDLGGGLNADFGLLYAGIGGLDAGIGGLDAGIGGLNADFGELDASIGGLDAGVLEDLNWYWRIKCRY